MSNHFLFLFLLWSAPLLSASDEPSGFVYAGCSEPKYPLNSPYQYSVESVLSSLANSASFSSFSNFTSGLVSGLFQCGGDLSLPDCSSCVRSALSRLSSLCPSAASAALQLRSCYIRYGNDSFVGRPDTSLLYKTCSSSLDPPTGLLEARDGALLSLAGGPYRVSAAGGVRAESQCVGDLTARDCSGCVSAAAAQVKASCGGATAGEAYLGKCYLRYSYSTEARPYAYTTGGTEHGEETGKTLAIIIGLMAGVALIIIFLSFIKRREGGKY